MPERVKLFGEDVTEQLEPWLAELGRADREKLRILSTLAKAEKWSLDAAIELLFPEKSGIKRLDSFRALRKRLNDAAEEAGHPFALETDSKKEIDGDRLCWFLGPDRSVVLTEEFSRSLSEPLEHQPAVAPRGFSSTIDGRRKVRLYVCQAPEDRAPAQILLRDLRMQLSINQKFQFELWNVDGDLHLGEARIERMRDEMEKADGCLVLVSPALLSASSFNDHELPTLQQGPYGPVCLPVNLGGLDPDRQDLRDFDLLQTFPDFGKQGYPTSGKKRSEFAQELAKQIHDRLERHFAGGTSAQLFFISNGDLPRVVEKPRGGRMSLGHGEKIQAAEEAMAVLQGWALDANAFPFFALLGEYGIGKTTTLRMLTHVLLEERKTRPDVPLPIYVDLRDYRGKNPVPELEEMLTEIIAKNRHLEGPRVTAKMLLHQVRRKGAVMLFDGLDERIVHLSPGEGAEFIRNLWSILPDLNRKAKAGVQRGKFLISCRSHYFRDLASQAAMLVGEDREGIRRKEVPAFCLLPFDENQIRNYLKQFLGEAEKAEEAMALISRVHNLTDLATRPYLLHLITEMLGRLEQESASGATMNAARLYEIVVDSWLNRDNTKHQLSLPHKKLLMEELAAALWRSETKQWPVVRLEEWFDEFLYSNPAIQGAYADVKREILKEDLRTSTFVLRPDNEEREFRFAHSSLQEYFLACYLNRALLKRHLERWQMPRVSVETLDFLGQMMTTNGIASLNALLEAGEVSSGSLAFVYWMRAVEKSYEAPEPRQVNLPGADLSGLTIRGKGAKSRLRLRGANFAKAILRDCRLQDVDLQGANFRDIQAERTEWLDVEGQEVDFRQARLDGGVWRGGSLRKANLSGTGVRSLRIVGVPLGEAQLDVNWQSEADSNWDGGMDKSQVRGMMPPPGHSGNVWTCAFSPDGAGLASASSDSTVKVWDVATGECRLSLSGNTDGVWSCAFSPDGASLAGASADSTVKVWNVATGECHLSFSGHADSVWSCAFSPDGASLASASADHTVKVWDVATGECRISLSGHTDSVWSCAFSPDGASLASASADHTVKVWDVATGECRISLSGHTDWVRSCAFSPDGGCLASASDDRTVKVWDVDTGECRLSLSGNTGVVWSCAFSPDGASLASASSDSNVKVWDVATGECRLSLSGHTDWVRSCAFSPDGALLASASDDQIVKVWDVATGKCRLSLSRHTNGVLSCGFSPDGTSLVSASDDRTVKVRDVATGECHLSLSGHSGRFLFCAFSPDGAMLASVSADRAVQVWDVAARECRLTLKGHTSRVWSCAFSPDGASLASASDDRTVKVWDATTGECRLSLIGHLGSVFSCAFSPDGASLASASVDSTVKVWDVATGECRLTLSRHSGSVLFCTFSPNGASLASASTDHTVKVSDVTTGECRISLSGHTNWVRSCAFSPDGASLASASEDHTVKVWDLATGECRLSLNGHTVGVMSCAFSPDGASLVSVSADSIVKVWDTATGACLRTHSPLPDGEWASFDEQRQEFRAVSPGAWRYWGWRYWDPETKRHRMLPAEAFGPLPVVYPKQVDG